MTSEKTVWKRSLCFIKFNRLDLYAAHVSCLGEMHCNDLIVRIHIDAESSIHFKRSYMRHYDRIREVIGYASGEDKKS